MTPPQPSPDILVVRRTISAPRERVFDAWLNPQQLARVMRPGSTKSATAEVDARVGGEFRIVMDDDREPVAHWGRYLVIDRPSRLEFTWESRYTDGQTTVTIELIPRDDGKTDLVLTHRGLPSRTFEDHQQGWSTIVGLVEAVT